MRSHIPHSCSSTPAQREANQRKADQLGATIIEEFVDAGESARKADRPELMLMIQYVAKHKTNYCIVHKVDRLARNRADDVTIHLALKDAGVTLVSATENIDETPSGMLLHGIMSSIAEFYSRNLATEVVKGPSQKAAQGGTVTKAPIGYRNVGVRDEFGRRYAPSRSTRNEPRWCGGRSRCSHPVTGRRASSTTNSWRAASRQQRRRDDHPDPSASRRCIGC